MGEKFIKSPNVRSVKSETAEAGTQRDFMGHTASLSGRSRFQLQSKQIGAEHAGRQAWYRNENGITLLYERICLRKVNMLEVGNKIPEAFGKNRKIGIKFKEMSPESILVDGMIAEIIK